MAVEEEAIAMYKRHITICEEEGDLETKAIYEEILADEERHQKLFGTLKRCSAQRLKGNRPIWPLFSCPLCIHA